MEWAKVWRRWWPKKVGRMKPDDAREPGANRVLVGGTCGGVPSPERIVNPAGEAVHGSAGASGAAPIAAVGGSPDGGDCSGLGTPTPLTAGFPSSHWDARPEIDRLSFTCKVAHHTVPAFVDWVLKSTSAGERYNAKTPGYRYAWTLGDGIHMEFGDKASGACKGSQGMLRFDYNPAKHALHAVPGLSRFISGPWNITRLDVCIDYPLDLSAGLIRHESLRKGATFHGQDGRLETVYLGSRNSPRLFRVYDKKRERAFRGECLDIPVLWRVEVEYRCSGNEPLPAELFDGLRIGYLKDASKLAWATRQVMAQVTLNPSVLSDAPRETRSRYKKLLDKHSLDLNPTPAEAYRAALPRLRTELFALQVLAQGGEVHEQTEHEASADRQAAQAVQETPPATTRQLQVVQT